MSPELFIVVVGLSLALFYQWAFRVLPREQWQFLAAIPGRKGEDGSWVGTNLTGYGLFTALAIAIGVAMLMVLLAAAGVDGRATISLLVVILGLAIPAARLSAWLIEGKRHTFSVAGAVFIAGVTLPWLVALWNRLPASVAGSSVPMVRFCAALVVAYSYGESIGRLACLSFGCCYGCRISSLPPRLARFFAPLAVVFRGETKKVAYAGNAAGLPLVPIQALTATVLGLIALLGTWLFLSGHDRSALFVTLTASQGWRFFSEFLRDDHRGGAGKVSAYQLLAVGLIIYLFIAVQLFHDPVRVRPDALVGVLYLWSPSRILSLGAIFLFSLHYFGLSEVTTSSIAFRVRHDRI
ncbi:MAG: prolipoprotein diacylglyceryl transferase [Acidobacteria bacterium]|nr:prolipoprotein diacylglyceryl transferase [Acidobacteriota bacterium]